MSRKAKSIAPSTEQARTAPFPSLREGPSPQERLAEVLKQAEERGLKPITGEEFDKHLQEFTDLWPDEEIDAFLAWLHQSRRQGRY